MPSDIFEEYAKIAEEQGLISLAEEPKESKELKKYKNDKYPRIGSDDIKTIENLYNVKPDSHISYDLNIFQAAHPNSVVISPAYDKINGLIENENQRHDIIRNLITNPTNGILTGKKLARQELLMELIRVANDMDNRNFDDLRMLADSCISDIEKKKLNKSAIAPLIWVGLGAAVLAGVWIWQHMNNPDKGLLPNIDTAVAKLNDLKTNSWWESDVDENLQKEVDGIISKLNGLRTVIVDFNSAMEVIDAPRSLKEIGKLKGIAEESGEDVKAKIETFKIAIKNIAPVLVKAIGNFTNRQYQLQHSKPSWLGDVSGWAGEAMHGRWGLIANDFISASNALETLKDALKGAYDRAMNVDNLIESNEQGILEAIGDSGVESVGPKSDWPKVKVDKEDAGYDELLDLLGHEPTNAQKEFFKSLK